ncbi:GAF domain-containing protein [Geobacter hydrogenophilus]|uniref:GAF domain-containing sensor histidine kinase n=1 Tax=Geobacter hydrogenophilus TaxID=40983 RepID=UPI001BDB0551|nr:ATP-binding protein [Geobacter hydrogenophilus]MBT0895146.1 GAF domain-containing protein [Geobacter hydrogenophilus]
MENREKLLEQLTGVDSSKLNYYIELKKRNQEILKQNSRLEILQQLTRDINIDMSMEDILERAFTKFPQTLPCDFFGLVRVRDGELRLMALMPRDFCRIDNFPAHSPTLNVISNRKAGIYNLTPEELCHVQVNPHYPGPLRSLAIAPMFHRDEVIGALIVASVVDGAYSEADLSFVQHLADQLSISIQNARLYKQVSRAKKEWEETFLAVTDPIFLVDTDYNVLLHNNRLSPAMSGFWNQAVSNKCFARLHGRTHPCENCPIKEVQRTGKPVFQRWQTDAGLLLDISYYPVFNEEKQLSAVTIIIKDVTDKTKMEAQLVQTAKLAALGEMAAGVAHELNSPMTVIIGTAQLLLRELQQDAQYDRAEVLEDIVNSGLRCKRIIQNLLTFSRQNQPPATDVDLNAEVERVLSMIQYQINRSQIKIVEQLAPFLPRLTANGPQIQQVLTNLLINARDALGEVDRKEKLITVATALLVRDRKKWAVLSVRDNGVGIAPENLSKIFTPFYTSKEATKGTGLGLSVSLGIAESHNGTIEVESRLGEGSTFSLLLPIEL